MLHTRQETSDDPMVSVKPISTRVDASLLASPPREPVTRMAFSAAHPGADLDRAGAALYRADGVMPRSHKAVISVLALLLIAFQVVTAGLDEMNVPRVGANGLPACDSAFMKAKTVEALNNGPDARVSGLQAYDVVNASPSPVDLTAGGKEIGCVMNVTTNAGLRPVIAVFTWQDAARSKWFIQTVGGL